MKMLKMSDSSSLKILLKTASRAVSLSSTSPCAPSSKIALKLARAPSSIVRSLNVSPSETPDISKEDSPFDCCFCFLCSTSLVAELKAPFKRPFSVKSFAFAPLYFSNWFKALSMNLTGINSPTASEISSFFALEITKALMILRFFCNSFLMS